MFKALPVSAKNQKGEFWTAALSQNILLSLCLSSTCDRAGTPSPKKDTKRGTSLGSGGTFDSSNGHSESTELSGELVLLLEGVLDANPDSEPESRGRGDVAG